MPAPLVGLAWRWNFHADVFTAALQAARGAGMITTLRPAGAARLPARAVRASDTDAAAAATPQAAAPKSTRLSSKLDTPLSDRPGRVTARAPPAVKTLQELRMVRSDAVPRGICSSAHAVHCRPDLPMSVTSSWQAPCWLWPTRWQSLWLVCVQERERTKQPQQQQQDEQKSEQQQTEAKRRRTDIKASEVKKPKVMLSRRCYASFDMPVCWATQRFSRL